MPEQLALLRDLGVAFALAFIGGALAQRLRQSPLVGYIAAGMVIGPFTPGFVGDPERVGALAEIGIIFLLFALGMEFSLESLGRLRRLALLGTVLQLLGCGALGFGLGRLFGWSTAEALYLAAIIAISSTVVVLKTLLARGEAESTHGRALLAMLVVQDLATVVLIVALPPLTGGGGAVLPALGVALGKAALYIAATVILGRRVIPPLLNAVARFGHDELFILATAALALGAALGAIALGLSAALGAFLAGMLVGRSEVEHRALSEVLPLRDLFTSLFFVSVGMLIDPRAVAQHLGVVIALAAAIIVFKGAVATAVALLPTFHLSSKTALFVGLGLAQIAEFSYVLAQQGVGAQVLSTDQYTEILAASVITVVLTPALFWGTPRLDRALARLPLLGLAFQPGRRGPAPLGEAAGLTAPKVIVVGCGRVGSRILRALHAQAIGVVGIDQQLGVVEALRREGLTVLYGDASYPAVLAAARPERAAAVVVALPDLAATRVVVRRAHALRADLVVIARSTSTAATLALRAAGASAIIEPEREGSLELLRCALAAVGLPEDAREGAVAKSIEAEDAALARAALQA